MRTYFTLTAVMVLSAFATAFSSLTEEAVTMRGQITDRFGHRLPGTTVEAKVVGSQNIVRAVTDPLGMYSMELSSTGEVAFTVHATGFVSANDLVAVYESAGTWNEGLAAGTLDESMWAFELTGRVVDNTGQPQPNVPVRLQAALTRSVTFHAVTDLSGSFRFSAAPEGIYIVSAVTHAGAAAALPLEVSRTKKGSEVTLTVHRLSHPAERERPR